jgi:glycosyltransferase involved in cell wall biosynthesis
MNEALALSVVIPVYNEVDSLPELVAGLHEAGLPEPWEAVLVDDGSTDGSAALLETLARHDTHLAVIAFRRNFGQTAAMAAGIAAARGTAIAFMDADLQNDPADLPLLLSHLAGGADAACGWRVDRQDRWLTRTLPSRLANSLISRVTGVRLHDYGCTLKAFRREMLTGVRLYGEMHRFLPVYAAQSGGTIVEVPVRHHARRFGTSKYGLERTVKVLLDLCTVRLLTAYGAKPAYLFGRVGVWCLGLAIVPLVAALGIRTPVPALLLALAALMLMIGGVQCVLMGLLAEMLARTHHESQGKVPYVVARVIREGVDVPLTATA